MKQQPHNRKASAPENPTAAEGMAIQALGFLASDQEELGRFLALTGLEPGQIREAAQEPGFLAGVLEYVCAHQPLLLAFARESGLDPAEIERGLEALAGRRWSRDVP